MVPYALPQPTCSFCIFLLWVKSQSSWWTSTYLGGFDPLRMNSRVLTHRWALSVRYFLCIAQCLHRRQPMTRGWRRRSWSLLEGDAIPLERWMVTVDAPDHNPSNGWILCLVHVSVPSKWEEHKFMPSTRTVFSATRFEQQRVECLDEFFSGLPSHCFDLFPLVACREKNWGLEYSLNTPGPIFGWHPANDLVINGSDVFLQMVGHQLVVLSGISGFLTHPYGHVRHVSWQIVKIHRHLHTEYGSVYT